jgi:rhodanese-related sulfurtransferase
MGSINIPLNQLYQSLDQFPEDKFFIIFCAGGYRSMIAASILRQKGFTNFVDVIGGFKEIGTTTIPCSEYVCPSTLL